METDIFFFIFICCHAFRVYIIYRFYKLVFPQRKTSRQTELISFALFFAATVGTDLFIGGPALGYGINLLAFILLTKNYDAPRRKRILTAVGCYLAILGIESFIVHFFYNIPTNIWEESIKTLIYIPLETIAADLILYILVLIFSNLKKAKTEPPIPEGYWLFLAAIPLISLYMLNALAQSMEFTATALCAVLLLCINFSTFYLYDKVIDRMTAQMEKEMLRRENSFYEHRLEEMQDSMERTKRLRHDLNNHRTAIMAYAERGETEEILSYLAQLEPTPLRSEDPVSTGNTAMDSVLSCKFHEAAAAGIALEQDITVPKGLGLAPADSVIILGNLLDNAIRAAKDSEKPWIATTLHYNRGVLTGEIANACAETQSPENNEIPTTKADPEAHGYGLKNVKQALEKYNGLLKLSREGNTFRARFLLYIPKTPPKVS